MPLGGLLGQVVPGGVALRDDGITVIDHGQTAALEHEHTVRRLGEHAADRAALIPLAAHVLRPVGDDFIWTGNVIAALWLLWDTDLRPCRLLLASAGR